MAACGWQIPPSKHLPAPDKGLSLVSALLALRQRQTKLQNPCQWDNRVSPSRLTLECCRQYELADRYVGVNVRRHRLYVAAGDTSITVRSSRVRLPLARSSAARRPWPRSPATGETTPGAMRVTSPSASGAAGDTGHFCAPSRIRSRPARWRSQRVRRATRARCVARASLRVEVGLQHLDPRRALADLEHDYAVGHRRLEFFNARRNTLICNLRTGNEPNQLGFFPRCRRNLRGRPSTSGGRAEDDRVDDPEGELRRILLS
jgi:hypothetical protein